MAIIATRVRLGLGALRSLLAFALLSLWLSPAGAFCVSEFAYDYVMRDDSPAPEQSLPLAGASVAAFLGEERDRPLEGRAPSTAQPLFSYRIHAVAAPSAAARLPLPWRPYCERSSRLLR